MDEDSDDDSVELIDSETQSHGKRTSKKESSEEKPQIEIEEEEPEPNLKRKNMLNMNLNQIFSKTYDALSLIQLLHLV